MNKRRRWKQKARRKNNLSSSIPSRYQRLIIKHVQEVKMTIEEKYRRINSIIANLESRGRYNKGEEETGRFSCKESNLREEYKNEL